MLRGTGKTQSISIWDEFQRIPETKVSNMIKRFKESTVPTEGLLIKAGRGPITITIPPHSNIVTFLRLMYIEHKSGKLYVRRQLSVWGTDKHNSDWEVIMWGGGRTNPKKIQIKDVRKDKLPKTIKLIELVSG